MVRDVIKIDGQEYEIVWSGGEGLIGDRETRSSFPSTPTKRIYNKKPKEKPNGNDGTAGNRDSG